MSQRRPAARPSAAAVAATQRQQQQDKAAVGGHGEGSGSSTRTTTATHLYASSVAVPPRSSIEQLESQLLERAVHLAPFAQRDVILQRRDDVDSERMALEQADSSYGPMRRARLQSRLHVRLERGHAQLRLYSQAQQRAPTAAAATSSSLQANNNAASATSLAAQGGSASTGAANSKSSEPEYIRVKNLTCSAIGGDEAGEQQVNDGLDDADIDVTDGTETVPRSIDPAHGLWKDVTAMMGWIPHHTVVRRGRRFVIRQDEGHSTEVFLFHLYKLDETSKTSKLQKISDTLILQIASTVSLMGKQDMGNIDPAKMTERVCTDIVALHDGLRGLAEFAKDVE